MMTPRRKLVCIALCALGSVGCGGANSPPSNSLHGSVAGQTFVANGATFGAMPSLPNSQGTGTAPVATLTLASTQPDCSGSVVAPALEIYFYKLAAGGGSNVALTPGTYVVSDSITESTDLSRENALAWFLAGTGGLLDGGTASAATVSLRNAVHGSATIDHINQKTGGTLTGSFDISFPSATDDLGDEVTGTFDASFCDYSQTN